MIGLWTLLLSIAVLAITIAAVILCFRSGNRIAIVLSLDAGLIALLGILLNATTLGELPWTDLLIFDALPLACAVIGTIVAFRNRQDNARYTGTEFTELAPAACPNRATRPQPARTAQL